MEIRSSIARDPCYLERSKHKRETRLRDLVIPTSMNVMIRWRSKLQRKLQPRRVSNKKQSITHTMRERYAAGGTFQGPGETRRAHGV
ncbi:hypothetical protein YC2023_001419 [Brassica napus]